MQYLVFITGLLISGVAAYYSIIGLTSIFAGAFWPVVIMGSSLEVGKLVAASWLYNNWKVAPRFIRYYLCTAVVILMLITSMGIFGFLSKAHIEQNINLNTGVTEQIDILNSQIENMQASIADIDKQIAQIDSAVDKRQIKGKQPHLYKRLRNSVRQEQNSLGVNRLR